jgi:crotonobetainyl-CoA:carnitine CoA-transferase CaiB-like acyl-CoA transferase
MPRSSDSAESPPRRPPLSGVRVLDLSNLLAGPMATMYLADFGAEVLKVEHPRLGDDLRNWGFSKEGVGLFFKVVNRNKRAITLNLKDARGQALCRRLVSRTDVVVENFRPGTLERWNLGYDELRAANPGVIMARVTGYGQTGPYAHRPGFGTIAEAFSGMATTNGYIDRPPLLPGFGLADATTAIHVAYGITLALYERDRNGGAGQVIDVGLYEGLFTLLGSQVVDFDQLGIVAGRMGGRLPFVSPRNAYETSDGKWVAIAGGTQHTFERITEALGISDVLEEPRFATNASRLEHAEELDDRVREAVRTLTMTEVLSRCEAFQAPVGPAYDVAEVFEDPHYRERGNISAIPDEELGPIKMQSVVPRLVETPGEIVHAGPPMGAHNIVVYRELLGVDEEEYDSLGADGVI